MDKLSQQGNGVECVFVILMRDGCILTGQRHYTSDVWKDISVWTIPGGRSELGETLEATLRRETAEEVGIKNIVLVDFIGDAPGAKEGDHILIYFGTTEQEPQLMEPHKFSEWRFVPVLEYLNNEQFDGFNQPARRMVAQYLATVLVLPLPARLA